MKLHLLISPEMLASKPDSVEVEEWYNENSELFSIPQRRSVLLAYTNSTLSGTADSYTAFSELISAQTVLDSDGNLVPKPLSSGSSSNFP